MCAYINGSTYLKDKCGVKGVWGLIKRTQVPTLQNIQLAFVVLRKARVDSSMVLMCTIKYLLRYYCV